MGMTTSSFINSLVSKPRQRGVRDLKKGRSAVDDDEGDDDDDDDDTDGPASCHCRSRSDDVVCLVCSYTLKNVACRHTNIHKST